VVTPLDALPKTADVLDETLIGVAVDGRDG
jgi:hypothetical protein